MVSQVLAAGSLSVVGPSAAEEPHELTSTRPTASPASEQSRLIPRIPTRSAPVTLTDLDPVVCELFETVCMLIETSQIPYWFQIY